MKRILNLLALVFLFFFSDAQTIRTNNMPNFQQFGSSVTQTRINGILYPVVGYAPAIYTDTTDANLNLYLKSIPFVQISTTSDGKNWYRNLNVTKWEEMGSGSAGWGTTGNLNTFPGINYMGTNDDVGLFFRVNGKKAGYISSLPDAISTTAGDVHFGQYAGESSDTTVLGNTLIGNSAGRYIGSDFGITGLGISTGNVMVGTGAGHYTQHPDIYGFGRNTFVGSYSGFNNIRGGSNTALGTFSLELNNAGSGSVALGRDALRSNIDGFNNTAVGTLSLLYNSTGIGSIDVTSGGSGYTTATVTISPPYSVNPTGACGDTAKATAVIDGGVITGIIITDPGCGYSYYGGTKYTGYAHPAVTVTITGDGVGATATANIISGTSNTAVGVGAGVYNRLGYSNSFFGNSAGLASRYKDSLMLFLGTNTDVSSGVNILTNLSKSVAIGYNAKVAKSNTFSIGGTGADTVSVVIGGDTARAKIDVLGGDILVHELTLGRGRSKYITNTMFGYQVGDSLTTGQRNTIIGYEAGRSIAAQSDAVIIGYRASKYHKYSAGNVAIGSDALYQVPGGNYGSYYSVSIGKEAAYNGNNVKGVAIGYQALYSAYTNQSNATDGTVAVGAESLKYLTTTAAVNNTGIGYYAGGGLTTGVSNTAIGSLSMGRSWSGIGGAANGTGGYNTAVGTGSMFYTTTSSYNTGIGVNVFSHPNFTPTIGYNIGIGYNAGSALRTGNYNVILGSDTGNTIAYKSNHVIISDGQGKIKVTYDSLGNATHTGRINAINTPASGTATDSALTVNRTTGDYEMRPVSGSGGFGDGIVSLGNSPYGLTKPNDSTYAADTSQLATILQTQHRIDSLAALKLAITDTTGQWIGSGWLASLVKYVDTTTVIATRTWVQAQGYVTTRDRLGFSGEDVTASANRTFNLNNYKFDLDSGSFHIKRKVTGQRSDDIFSVGIGATKSFYVNEVGNVYATELFAGSGSFSAIGGLVSLNSSTVRLNGSTTFNSFQKKFEFIKEWPAIDSIGFEIKNDTSGISTLPATWADTYKIVSMKYRSGVDNSLTERFDFRGNGDFNITGTGAMKINVGNTAQRPSSAVAGHIRFNSDSIGTGSALEVYNGTDWVHLGSSGGGGSDGYVSAASFDPSNDYLTITQVGAANVYARIKPSYIRNSLHEDSITKRLNDSTLLAKAVTVTTTDNRLSVTREATDSTLKFTIGIKRDTVTLASFGAGGAQAGDTTAFSTSTIYGSFYNDGTDTLVITSMRGVLQGTSPSVTYDVYFNDSLNVTAGASKLVTAGTALTNTATGAAVTSFDNTKIPPGVWVWVKTTTVTTKPTYFSLSLIGYKSRI